MHAAALHTGRLGSTPGLNRDYACDREWFADAIQRGRCLSLEQLRGLYCMHSEIRVESYLAMSDQAPSFSEHSAQDTALAEHEAQIWIEVGGHYWQSKHTRISFDVCALLHLSGCDGKEIHCAFSPGA